MVQAIDYDIQISKLPSGDDILNHVRSVEYDESSIELTDRPEATFTVWNPGGVEGHLLKPGDKFNILRNQQDRFHGVITTPTPEHDEEDGSWITLDAVQVGYKLLQAVQCDSYDFDEDGQAITTRDAVTINPWRYITFRDDGQSLDSRGNLPALDGVTFDNVVKDLIGTQFTYQIQFTDNSHLLHSQVDTSTNNVQVYRDGQDDDTRPSLQRVRDGTGYKAGDAIETVELMNGDPNIEEMGDISTVEVTVIGKFDGTNDVQVEACRNASESTRTFSSITLTRSENIQGGNYDKWTGTVDLSGDGATEKNRLALKFTIPGTSGDSATTKILYCKVKAVTQSDTGITEGTINAYSNPVTFDDGSENFFEGDLLGKNRLKGLETIRTQTESSVGANESPHWDLWIDHNEEAHFKERRGTDKNNLEYSFDEGNINVISHEFYGDELAYQTIALGAGSGKAQTRIVSKEEFSNGGLYDSDRDPDGSTQKYGDTLPRQMKFIDSEENSATNLLRKARAFHKLHRDPQETIEVELESEYVAYYNVGDGIPVKNLPTRTNDTLRVIKLKRKWTADEGENLDNELGQPRDEFLKTVSDNTSRGEANTIRPHASEKRTGLSGNGLNFDQNHFGIYSFDIPDGREVENVKLKIQTLPWQTNAKSAATQSFTQQTGGAGGANIVRKDFSDKTGTVESTDYGQQNFDTAAAVVNDGVSGNADGDGVSGDSDNSDISTNTLIDATQNEGAGSTHTFTSVNSPHSFAGVDFYVLRVSFAPNASTDVNIDIAWIDSNDNSFQLEAAGYSDNGTQVQTTKTVLIPKRFINDFVNDFDEIRVQITAEGSTGYSLVCQFYEVLTHSHTGGTLSTSSHALDSTTGLDDTDVDGGTDPKSLSPGSSLDAADLQALMAETRVGYKGTSGGTGTLLYSQGGDDHFDEHEHTFTVPSHDHELDFGVFQFDGDSGDGTGSPIYGTGVQLAVDPATNADGLPSDFQGDRMPHKFGLQGSQVDLELDVTGWLETDSNGVIKSGQHKVYFTSESDTDNADGLAVVSVTPIMDFKEPQNR